MRLITILTASLVTSISAFSITFDGPGAYVPPPKSVILSAVRAAASSQITSPALSSAIHQLPASLISGHNIPSDIAAAADGIIYAHDLSHLPAWLSAAPTNGPLASAINGDIASAFETRINGASLLTATGSAASAILASASADNRGGSSATVMMTSSSSTVMKMEDKSSTTSGTSTVTSGGSTRTSSSTQTSSSGSTGGAPACRATGAVMVVGAVAAGVVGIAGML